MFTGDLKGDACAPRQKYFSFLSIGYGQVACGDRACVCSSESFISRWPNHDKRGQPRHVGGGLFPALFMHGLGLPQAGRQEVHVPSRHQGTIGASVIHLRSPSSNTA